MHYYDVAIGAEKHWDTSVFTYSSETELDVFQLVNVPFGQKNKTGFVVRKTTKPTFKTRAILPYDISLSDESNRFISWFQTFYAAKPGQAFMQLLPNYLTKKIPKYKSEKLMLNDVKITLNSEQKHAKKEIITHPKPTILHGITGSGKTRLYTSLILDTLQNGKTALLLYPEISLTPQLLEELKQYAPVVAFHSSMSDAERSKAWYIIAQHSEPLIIIGPRSSLFLPHKNLGLIIIDEAHESTYKQENDIYYNSLMVAGGLSQAHSAKLVLGSATPPITETELILRNGGNLVCLHDKAIKDTHQVSTTVIDKKDRQKFSKSSLLSDALVSSIESSLKSHKQSLLFINRRGTAKLTLCEHCGWQAECLDCGLPLTYHHDLHAMLCHTCGKKYRVEALCPVCSQATSLKALGSKALVEEVAARFPEARIGRFDTDTKKDESFANQYQSIKGGDIDILIGTQQIVKGLDLPLLQTVGVIDADLSLHFPDYSSDERTFQLISQVAGRVGRGHGSGRIVIQTLHPASPIIALAVKEDWHSFRDSELGNRKEHHFPPYIYSVKVIFRDKSYNKALKRASTQKERILHKNVEVEGPLPSFIGKRGQHFYVQLHAKHRSRTRLLEALRTINDEVIIDLDPLTFL